MGLLLYLPDQLFAYSIPNYMKILHQAADAATTAVLTQYHVKPSFQDTFREALSIYILSSLRGTGNIMAEAHYEKGDPCILWVIERWRNKDLYNRHKKSRAAKVVNDLSKTGLAFPIEVIFIRDLELLSKATRRDASSIHDLPLIIMLFVEVKAGTEEHFKSVNQVVLPAFRDEPGILAFQLSQELDHTTRFIVYKKFRNQDAFQYHLQDPTIEPVIRFLQTSIKDPPFEKGYHYLIQFSPV